ncbi:hypothetical protein GEMRC1_012572 [Eukaryota sp. GEM-RC1]
MCTAVQHLHSRDLVHYDIRPQNIGLVNSQAKLAGFGSSQTIDNSITIEITTKYTPPEAVDRVYGLAFDVYSLGILLYEMFANSLAFEHIRDDEVAMAKQQKHVFSFPDGFPRSISSLITKCLSVNPRERPSINDVLKTLKEANSLELPRLVHQDPVGHDQMTIFISRSSHSNPLTLNVRPYQTIGEVKDMIYQREDIPLDRQRLVCAGQQLENDFTLQDY